MIDGARLYSEDTPRLLLILTEFPPSFGGMQTHAVELCRHLHRVGFHAEVATYRGPEVEFPFPVHRCLSRIGFTENLRILERLVEKTRPDLIYASTIFYGRLSASTGIPMVARSAGNDVLRPWIAWPYRWLSGVLSTPAFEEAVYKRFRKLDWPEAVECLLLDRRRAEMALSARHIRRILANSEYTAGLLRELAAGDVEILPGGVDARRFFPRRDTRAELGLPADQWVVMTACRMVPKKGLDVLLHAAARLPNVHLLVAGEGRQLRQCRETAERLGVAGRVTFTGRIAHDNLPHYYWAADQFVLASREHVDARTGLRDVETMGRVLCEAHAAGVPAIASRTGGIPSIVDDGRNGLLFEPDDPDGLVQCIERLRQDGDLSRHVVSEGLRDATERWDWSVICEAHERVFRGAAKAQLPASDEMPGSTPPRLASSMQGARLPA
ncbi:MAG: glycosyltransferase family 4 protein [Bryobacteraceae bacterium]